MLLKNSPLSTFNCPTNTFVVTRRLYFLGLQKSYVCKFDVELAGIEQPV